MSTESDTFEATGARRKFDEFVGGVKDRAEKSFEDLWTGARDYVKDNPGKTILVSLGIGLVLGSLLRRR